MGRVVGDDKGMGAATEPRFTHKAHAGGFPRLHLAVRLHEYIVRLLHARSRSMIDEEDGGRDECASYLIK